MNEEDQIKFDNKIIKAFVSFLVGGFCSMLYLSFTSNIVDDINSYIFLFSLIGFFFTAALLTYFISSFLLFLCDIIQFYFDFKDVDIDKLKENYNKLKK